MTPLIDARILAHLNVALFDPVGLPLSERVRVPFADAMLIALPAQIDPATAASAPDNIADAWRAIVPPLRAHPGGRVLILAGPGASRPLRRADRSCQRRGHR